MGVTKADQLLEQVLQMLKLLEHSSIGGYSDYDPTCYVCRQYEGEPHTKNCSLHQTIQDIKAYLQEKKDTSVPVDHERGCSKLFKS